MINKIFPATFFGIMLFSACSKKMMPIDSSNGTGIQAWNTTGDEAKLLEKQPALIPFTANTSSVNVIEVKESEKFQTIDGFGYSLTGGSAQVINRLPHNVRSSLLKE